jgi:hypothetical protein
VGVEREDCQGQVWVRSFQRLAHQLVHRHLLIRDKGVGASREHES